MCIYTFFFYILSGINTYYFLFQSVEEAECQRAYELGTEVYMSSFDRSRSPEEVSAATIVGFAYFGCC